MVPMMLRSAVVCGLVVCGLVVGAVVHISAQDPAQTLPDAYKVQFENDYVRVVRVHYEAGAKLPEHTHPGGTTVYVYLNDSDGVVFRHSGRGNRAVTRPAVKTGGVRVASGPEEHHTAENPASTPSDFLRIWLKTETADGRTMRRLSPTDEKFENQQLRITRIIVAENKLTQVSAPATAPSLIVWLPGGHVQWLAAGQSFEGVRPHGNAEVLRIDFLTAPK
jgi:redox-sensitive bicupin YhaK (pirin superfamily)